MYLSYLLCWNRFGSRVGISNLILIIDDERRMHCKHDFDGRLDAPLRINPLPSIEDPEYI